MAMQPAPNPAFTPGKEFRANSPAAANEVALSLSGIYELRPYPISDVPSNFHTAHIPFITARLTSMWSGSSTALQPSNYREDLVELTTVVAMGP